MPLNLWAKQNVKILAYLYQVWSILGGLFWINLLNRSALNTLMSRIYQALSTDFIHTKFLFLVQLFLWTRRKARRFIPQEIAIWEGGIQEVQGRKFRYLLGDNKLISLRRSYVLWKDFISPLIVWKQERARYEQSQLKAERWAEQLLSAGIEPDIKVE